MTSQRYIEERKVAHGSSEPTGADMSMNCPVQKILDGSLDESAEEALSQIAESFRVGQRGKCCTQIFPCGSPQRRQSFLDHTGKRGNARLPRHFT